jgi:hypothetical protein
MRKGDRCSAVLPGQMVSTSGTRAKIPFKFFGFTMYSLYSQKRMEIIDLHTGFENEA